MDLYRTPGKSTFGVARSTQADPCEPDADFLHLPQVNFPKVAEGRTNYEVEARGGEVGREVDMVVSAHVRVVLHTVGPYGTPKLC